MDSSTLTDEELNNQIWKADCARVVSEQAASLYEILIELRELRKENLQLRNEVAELSWEIQCKSAEQGTNT